MLHSEMMREPSWPVSVSGLLFLFSLKTCHMKLPRVFVSPKVTPSGIVNIPRGEAASLASIICQSWSRRFIPLWYLSDVNKVSKWKKMFLFIVQLLSSINHLRIGSLPSWLSLFKRAYPSLSVWFTWCSYKFALGFLKQRTFWVSFCFCFCFSLSTPSHLILPLTMHLVCCLLLLFMINTFLLLCVGVPWPSCSTGSFCLLNFSTILSVGEQFMTNSQPGF